MSYIRLKTRETILLYGNLSFFGPFIERGNQDQLSVVIWRRKVEVSRHVGECGVNRVYFGMFILSWWP